MIAFVLAPLLAVASPAPQACGVATPTPTAQHAPVHAQKLGDLPDAEMDLAVLRSVDGCAVREVIRFNVSQKTPPGGATAAPTPGFRGQLVPEGATARTTPTSR